MENQEEWKCQDCGISLGKDDGAIFCSDCKRKRNTKHYRNIGIVILIVGFIAGLVLGNVFKVPTLTHESTFNFTWAFSVWISSTLVSIFMFAICSICHRLDLIIDKNNSTKNIKK